MRLEHELEETGGDLTPEMEIALEITQKNLQEKCTNYIHYINRLKTEIGEAKIYKAKVDHYIKMKGNTIARLEKNLHQAVENFGPIEAEFSKISYRKSTRVIVDKPDEIPNRFKTVKQDLAINLNEVKKELVSGAKVKGAHLETFNNLSIR
jgi:hypothetical protein